MPLKIETFPAGSLETNAYLVIDDAMGAAIVIDAPEGIAAMVGPAIRDGDYRVERIVVTHGHWAHIAGLAALARELAVPVAIHPLVLDRVERPAADLPVAVEPWSPEERLDEGDTVTVGGHTFAVLHLPGHDPGHIVLHDPSEGVVLGGDVLFPGGHGRTDIPGSDQVAMDRSLARLAALPDATVVYPGHGAPATIGAERGWLPTGSGGAER
ncbi:MAG: MBL fold metallo-hydrolase [Chloroflexia bacterium]|nr:MBL fold metallo-hydrolase [Chloroflexia bacterium]